MAKKIVKKRKIRIFRLLLFLLSIGGLCFCSYLYLRLPIKNIIVKNTEYLNDDYILELAGINKYPSYYLTSTGTMKKRLKKSPYVEDVTIKRKFYHVLEIKIKENKALYFSQLDKHIVFEDKKSVEVEDEITFRVPRLLNYVPDDKFDAFCDGMSHIKEDILSKISDIEYQPNDLDKERFLLYMDDGNMVYLTLTKFNMINYYNDVLSQLEDRKGILYLDNGNHFQIKE